MKLLNINFLFWTKCIYFQFFSTNYVSSVKKFFLPILCNSGTYMFSFWRVYTCCIGPETTLTQKDCKLLKDRTKGCYLDTYDKIYRPCGIGLCQNVSEAFEDFGRFSKCKDFCGGMFYSFSVNSKIQTYRIWGIRNSLIFCWTIHNCSTHLWIYFVFRHSDFMDRWYQWSMCGIF